MPNKFTRGESHMSINENNSFELLTTISRQMRNMDEKINRIETKLDYVLEIMEVLFESDEDELIDDMDESWASDPEAWRGTEEDF